MYAYIDSISVYNVYDDISIYSEDFKLHCVEIPEGITVEPGYAYDAETNTFTAPPPIIPSPVSEYDLEAAKDEKIQESKAKLSEWLNDNPILYTDGKYYSVTEEKQSLLNNNLASYERATAAGIEYPLKWNSTGSECVAWDYSELLALSLTIAGYVAPKVSMQQSVELEIKSCSSIDEINAVVIDYDNDSVED